MKLLTTQDVADLLQVSPKPTPIRRPTSEETRRFQERLARWLADVAQNTRRAA